MFGKRGSLTVLVGNPRAPEYTLANPIVQNSSSAVDAEHAVPKNSESPDFRARRRQWILCLLLALGTLLVFWRVRSFEFLNYDDPEYVRENPVVQQGLTGAGVAWAMHASHASNWHPLTWISHMLDCQFFGLNPAQHHFTNLLFHVANALLLFLVLRKMTGALWRSFFVATIFAVHPMHVESVAWVSERKDVLSGFFFMLTIWAYVCYVERKAGGKVGKRESGKSLTRSLSHSLTFYLLAVGFFALGLMSKPMVVTLPFVLLLLDFWPLQRVTSDEWRVTGRKMVLEKIPFFVLSAAACVITFLVQKKEGAVSSLQSLSVSNRVGNALVSYPRYVWKAFWPADLSPLYPHPGAWPFWMVAVSAAVLVAITILAIRLARRAPYLPIGWFWFLGTLVPVIGLVQVGIQSMADRYTYLSMIGLLFVITWGACDLARRWNFNGTILFFAGALAIVGCVAITLRQLPVWQNSISLYERVLAVGFANPIYRKALETRSPYADVRNNFGHALADAANEERDENVRQKKLEEAIAQYEAGLKLNPKHVDLLDNFGNLLSQSGHPDQAIALFSRALQIDSQNATLHTDLGVALGMMGKIDDAVAQLQQAVQLNPNLASAHANLGNAFAMQGKLPQAIAEFSAAVRLRPYEAYPHFNYGVALAQSGRRDEAAAQFREALRLKPDYEPAQRQLNLLGTK